MVKDSEAYQFNIIKNDNDMSKLYPDQTTPHIFSIGAFTGFKLIFKNNVDIINLLSVKYLKNSIMSPLLEAIGKATNKTITYSYDSTKDKYTFTVK